MRYETGDVNPPKGQTVILIPHLTLFRRQMLDKIDGIFASSLEKSGASGEEPQQPDWLY